MKIETITISSIMNDIKTINPFEIALLIYNIDEKNIISKKQTHKLVMIRSFICNIFRIQGMKLKDIGEKINRDHSSVIYLLNMIKERSIFDLKYKEELKCFNYTVEQFKK